MKAKETIRIELQMASHQTSIPLRAIALCATLLIAPWALAAQTVDHPEQYAPADVAAGGRVYTANCSNCHGPSGAGVGNVDLRRRSSRTTTDAALAALITSGIPGTGMLAVKLAPNDLKVLIAFVRTGLDPAAGGTSVRLGDPTRGKAAFEGPGKCLSCHRVGGRGSFVGPDLTEIGQLRPAAVIQQSLLDPTRSMRPINRPVRATLGDGSVITGRRLNEDSYTVQIVTEEGRLVSLVKSELKGWSIGTQSTMPPVKDMPAETLADLLAYLMTLRGSLQ